MRLHSFRAATLGAMALVLWSCTDSGITAPTAVPGDARLAVTGTGGLVITEVMPDPRAVADGSGEWFEVYNDGPTPIDLQGHRIVSAAGSTSSESHTIGAGVVVGPGEYVVLGNNANPATNGGAPVAYSYGGAIALNNGSSTSATEWLALRTAAGATLDSVAYAPRATPTSAPGAYTVPSGSSRGVIDISADNTVISGSNWLTSAGTYGAGDRGTPGQPNTGGAPAEVTVRLSYVTPGSTFRVTASAVDSTGKPAATSFTWSSDNTSVATINATTGVATGVSTGIALLTATSSNGVVGSAPLFVVNPGDVSSISLSMNEPLRVPAGYTKPVFPTTRTTDNRTVTPPLAWSSSNESVATVSELGYVTGVSAGRVQIRATAPNGVYNFLTIDVAPGTAPTSAVYRDHLEFGAPLGGAAGIVLDKPGFVSSYSVERGGPNWVSWNLNGTQFGGSGRCDCFSADQTLPGGVYRVVDFDYRSGGYDRGHMVQSDSRSTTEQENAPTFLMTNILPQAANNNQGPWSALESALNAMVRSGGKEAYVIAGGLYTANPTTLKDEGKVQIPDYTWKIAVVVDAGEGLADVRSTDDLQVIAVKMPNLLSTAAEIRNTPWQQFEVTVDQLERETGYDFLSKLPNRLEVLVESKTRAPLAVTDGPYTGLEGAEVTLSAAGSSDPDGDAITYAWDFGDGSTGTGVSPTHAYADNGNYQVTLTVTDANGAESTAATTVTVFNVAPSVAAFAGATLLPGETFAAAGTFADPGADTWTATVDYGDGSGARALALDGGGFSLRHTYAAAGTYTVTVTVTDDEDAAGTRTATVTVISAAQGITALQSQVSGLAGALGNGNANALNATLRAAQASLARGSVGAGVNQLEAFTNQVRAHAGNALTQPQADALITYARRIIASVQ